MNLKTVKNETHWFRNTLPRKISVIMCDCGTYIKAADFIKHRSCLRKDAKKFSLVRKKASNETILNFLHL